MKSKVFEPIVRRFIERERLVARENELLRRGNFEGREALWDLALEEIQSALSEAWNREIARLEAEGKLSKE